jgi:parallel beta-helix repeat protein
VNISGFTVRGAGLNGAGIYLSSGTHHCTVSNNTVSSNGVGIKLSNSSDYNTWNSTEIINYIYNGTAHQNYLGNHVFLEGDPVDGIEDGERYIAAQIANAGGEIRFMINDEDRGIHDRTGIIMQNTRSWITNQP